MYAHSLGLAWHEDHVVWAGGRATEPRDTHAALPFSCSSPLWSELHPSGLFISEEFLVPRVPRRLERKLWAGGVPGHGLQVSAPPRPPSPPLATSTCPRSTGLPACPACGNAQGLRCRPGPRGQGGASGGQGQPGPSTKTALLTATPRSALCGELLALQAGCQGPSSAAGLFPGRVPRS